MTLGLTTPKRRADAPGEAAPDTCKDGTHGVSVHAATNREQRVHALLAILTEQLPLPGSCIMHGY